MAQLAVTFFLFYAKNIREPQRLSVYGIERKYDVFDNLFLIKRVQRQSIFFQEIRNVDGLSTYIYVIKDCLTCCICMGTIKNCMAMLMEAAVKI